jgi:hypothetical protein
MLKFLKMTVAEDVITTEEVLVVSAEVVQVVTEVQLQEEKEILLQDVKVLADLEATEVQLLEKVVSDQEAIQLQELVVSLIDLQDLQMLHDMKVDFLKERQDVQKDLAMLQEKEDQEEAKKDSRF